MGTRLLVDLSPTLIPRAKEIALDGRALGFTAAIAVLTGILFGMAPAIHMVRTDLTAALREGGRGNAIGFRRNRLRSVLVISEVALSLVLLTGAGLLMRSFYRLQSMDPAGGRRGGIPDRDLGRHDIREQADAEPGQARARTSAGSSGTACSDGGA